jgi:RNA polymerase sigma-70 factor (ECF subfamily)
VAGLHALLALHHARRAARHDDAGAFVPLDAQDASRYDTSLVDEGRGALARVRALGGGAAYALQAEISATHVEAGLDGWVPERRWREVVRLYEALAERMPSPIVEVNRAVAVGRLEGPVAGLALLDAVAERRADRERLERYLPFQAALADLLARAGRRQEARAAFDRAIALSEAGPERRYLEKQRERLV